MKLMDDDNLIYLPPPEVSASFYKAFESIVPICPNERDRYLKFTWGMDRTDYCAGHQVHRYADLVNDPAKYIGRPQWVLECWNSPDIYDKKEWKELEHLLGPFPENGTYDFLAYHHDAEGNYLPLDETALDLARNWKYWQGVDKKVAIEEVMRKRMLRWSLQQQRQAAAAKVVSTRFGEEVVKLFESEADRKYSLPSGKYKETESGIIMPV